MSASVFEEMKSYIGFSDDDAANIATLKPCVQPHISQIVDTFYVVIMRHADARQILERGENRLVRLHQTLREWLESLFVGVYDDGYHKQRSLIGRVHVRVGLPQHYMITAMEVIWQNLECCIRKADPADVHEKLRSLHKLLALELGIMLDTYKETYSASVRQNERSAVEEQLTRAQHLAQIGQLAASLAHEIKNPLAGISGAIQIIREDMTPDHHHHAIIGEILAQIKRLDNAVKDLLIYARPVPPDLAPRRVNDIVKRIMAFIHDDNGARNASIRFDASPSDPLIIADDANIEQLVLNLLLNATQASPDEGVVVVSTEARNDVVLLIVQDAGRGMSSEARLRAFEPFYTTKARGTGLGLPICKRIVDAHAGTIVIDSSSDNGTCVTVQLPSATELQSPAVEPIKDR